MFRCFSFLPFRGDHEPDSRLAVLKVWPQHTAYPPLPPTGSGSPGLMGRADFRPDEAPFSPRFRSCCVASDPTPAPLTGAAGGSQCQTAARSAHLAPPGTGKSPRCPTPTNTGLCYQEASFRRTFRVPGSSLKPSSGPPRRPLPRAHRRVAS